ncbi:hypothetical protein Thiowin_02576 [Thiorhodovibrio winogradskyi]|uniref:Uncharacterized protein n=1 Tax=Thiorhodovibrio winogradskyi TaxID=77007 RepID=A0ABZ0SBS9_9GAMM
MSRIEGKYFYGLSIRASTVSPWLSRGPIAVILEYCRMAAKVQPRMLCKKSLFCVGVVLASAAAWSRRTGFVLAK